MSLINTKIKPFKNQAFKNGEFIEVTEKDTEGRWSVFFFYPADFTFVCPTELGDVADHYEELQKLGVDVYSVSTDTHFTHKAWHSSSETIAKIKYAMIGDPTGALTRNFDNMREDEGLLTVPPSWLTRRVSSRRSKLPLKVSAVMRLTCCVKSKRRSTLLLTQAKSARLNGKKAKRHWLRLWTWSVRFKSVCARRRYACTGLQHRRPGKRRATRQSMGAFAPILFQHHDASAFRQPDEAACMMMF